MLCVYLFVLFLLGYEARGAALQNPDNVVSFSDRLGTVIQRKCLKTADRATSNKALEGLHHFMRNWMVTLPDRKLNPKKFYNACVENSQNFTSYLSDFVDTLQPCLVPQERYLTDFILESYGNYNHYLCTYLGIAVKGSSKCATSLEQAPEINPLITCYKDSQVFRTNSSILDVLTKDELCSDVAQIHTCYEELLDKHCPNSPEYKNMLLVLLKNAIENCPESNNNNNTQRQN